MELPSPEIRYIIFRKDPAQKEIMETTSFFFTKEEAIAFINYRGKKDYPNSNFIIVEVKETIVWSV